MFKFITKFFHTRRHARELTKIYNGLTADPKLLIETQAKFETQFGKNQNRTRIQWRNLVRVYGIETVCQMESMSAAEVQRRCDETFSQKTLRELRDARVNKFKKYSYGSICN